MRLFISVVSVLLLTWAAPAQDQASQACPAPFCEEQWLKLQRELIQRQLENQNTSMEKELAERRAAEDARRELVRKLNRFVETWNRFVSEYNQQGTFNVKNARALTKAFREIEATGWPKQAR